MDLILPCEDFKTMEEVDLLIGKVVGAVHNILARLGPELA